MTTERVSDMAEEDPQTLEQKAREARQEVDQTLEALESRLSVKRRIRGASNTVAQAAADVADAVSPPITALIRLDHTHVFAAFRRFRRSMGTARKRALVANVCLALDIHARLEEEIFYPALFIGERDAQLLQKSVAEHDEMRTLSESLRRLSPDEPQFEETFYQLARTVLHHIADEETTLLPLAEVHLNDQLHRLGRRMNMRRIALLKPHAVEAAATTALTFPLFTGAMLAGVAATGWLLARGVRALRA